jgi:plastocyanin
MKDITTLFALVALMGAGCSAANLDQTSLQTPEVAPAATTKTPPKVAPPAVTTPLKPSAAQPVPKPSKPVPQMITVNIVDNAFSPQIIAAHAGDTIIWVNKGASPHTSVSDGSILWDSGNIKSGATYSHTFKSTGTYAYHCGVHPDMRGTIFVTDAQ